MLQHNMFSDKWLFCRCCNKSNMFNDKWLYSVGAARKITSSITNNSNLYVLQQKEHIQWQTNIYSSILYSIFCRYNKRMYTQYSVLYILWVLQPKEHIQWQMNIYSSIQYSTFCGCCNQKNTYNDKWTYTPVSSALHSVGAASAT